MILTGRSQATLAAYLFGSLLVSAQTLRIDFNHGSATQSGWDSIAAGDNDLGDSWSKTFPGSIGLDVDAIGSVGLDTRDRAQTMAEEQKPRCGGIFCSRTEASATTRGVA